MLNSRSYLVGLLLATGLAQVRPASQVPSPCDAQLVPAAGELGYRQRGGSARCEGLYRSPISTPGLELVSLHQGELRFTLDPSVRLRLLAPSGAARVKGEPLRIRAMALPLRTYYRLDGVTAADGALEWPVREVLLPIKLDHSQLGVFGWLASDVPSERLFVPVRIVTGEAGAGRSTGSTVMTVRTANDAERILWRSYTEPLTGKLPEWSVAAGSVTGGRAVSFKLPDGPEATLDVDVTAKSVNADRWSPLRVRVLRPASP